MLQPLDNCQAKGWYAKTWSLYTQFFSDSLNLFSPEKEELYKRRFEAGYDLQGPDYVAWLKINHPEAEAGSNYAGSSTASSSECHKYFLSSTQSDVLWYFGSATTRALF